MACSWHNNSRQPRQKQDLPQSRTTERRLTACGSRPRSKDLGARWTEVSGLCANWLLLERLRPAMRADPVGISLLVLRLDRLDLTRQLGTVDGNSSWSHPPRGNRSDTSPCCPSRDPPRVSALRACPCVFRRLPWKAHGVMMTTGACSVKGVAPHSHRGARQSGRPETTPVVTTTAVSPNGSRTYPSQARPNAA
jgi:hypothetical protein